MKQLINNYKKTLETLGFSLEKKNPPLHYKRQKGNPLNISTIDNRKIVGILENTGIVIDPKNEEHRSKYFQGVKPLKFIESLLAKGVSYNESLFRVIADSFAKDVVQGVPLKYNIYQADEIPNIYNMATDSVNDNGKRMFVGRGVSCMQDRPKYWFDVYKYTKGLRIATLEDEDGNIYARALLWADKHNGNPKVKNTFYLDRIYIANSLSYNDGVKAVYQAQLYTALCNDILQPYVNCYSISHFRHLLDTSKETRLGDSLSAPSDNFAPVLIEGKEALEFDYFPYADTFQGIDGNEYTRDYDGCDIALNQTDGSNGNDSTCTCDNCGNRIEEDETLYSENDGLTYCDECAVYSDYEDDAILIDEAVEHRHTGQIMRRDNLTDY